VTQHLAGTGGLTGAPRALPPYSEPVLEFLAVLSDAIMRDAEAKEYPDVISFGYWARRANLARLQAEFGESRARLGVGTVFHITPSNVPVNFAFSFAFGLLAGNANIVRVPTRDFAQVRIVTRLVKALLDEPRFAGIAAMTEFVRYEQNDETTRALTARCNARVIWGGDLAISNIRKIALPERATEVVFADRYSFCVMDAGSVAVAGEPAFGRLITGFYNDAYQMDQNACSSPHLVAWLGDSATVAEAQRRFWDGVGGVAAEKYELQPVAAMDKFTQACRNAVEFGEHVTLQRHDNFVYRAELDRVPATMDALRGRFGYFYECRIDRIEQLKDVVNNRYQTLTYFGVSKTVLRDFVLDNGLSGIDRIVPVGTALDISVIWDGYDVIRSLSRIVDYA